MRADAQRNRERIITCALTLFAEHGPTVSMDDIARAANLGVGTLYRHFPDRQALVLDIGTGALHDHLAFGRASAAQDTPAWQTLVDVVRHCATLPLALAKSLAETLPAEAGLSDLEQASNALFAQIITQAQQEGSLRRDIPTQEVVHLISVIVCRPGAQPDDHLTTVLLDGLHTSPA